MEDLKRFFTLGHVADHVRGVTLKGGKGDGRKLIRTDDGGHLAQEVVPNGVWTRVEDTEAVADKLNARIDGVEETVTEKVVEEVSDRFAPKTVTLHGDDSNDSNDEEVELSGLAVGNYDTIRGHVHDLENPHRVTKGQIGLGNVDDTSDMDKPVSTAVQEALDELGRKLSTVFRFMGSVDDYSNLPLNGNRPGDVYNIKKDGMNVVWVENGSNDSNDGYWDDLGASLEGYLTKDEAKATYQNKLTPGQGIDIDADAKISIADDGVSNSMLATNSVNGAKIANLSVSTGKLTNGAVSTAKIADGAVTAAKINQAVLGSLATKADATLTECVFTAWEFAEGLLAAAQENLPAIGTPSHLEIRAEPTTSVGWLVRDDGTLASDFCSVSISADDKTATMTSGMPWSTAIVPVGSALATRDAVRNYRLGPEYGPNADKPLAPAGDYALKNEIPDVPVKAVKRNGTKLVPDAQGAVDVDVPGLVAVGVTATNGGTVKVQPNTVAKVYVPKEVHSILIEFGATDQGSGAVYVVDLVGDPATSCTILWGESSYGRPPKKLDGGNQTIATFVRGNIPIYGNDLFCVSVVDEKTTPPIASDDIPKMNGTGYPGTSDTFARSDHVHPSDRTVFYATSATEGYYMNKTASTGSSGFSLKTGVVVVVRFDDTTSSATPTLNVDGTGAKSIRRYGTDATTLNGAWHADEAVPFVYDGTYWLLLKETEFNVWKSGTSVAAGNGSSTASSTTSVAIGNRATAGQKAIAISSSDGTNTTTASGTQSIAVGFYAKATANEAIAIGKQAQASAAGAVQIGYSSDANATANSLRFRDKVIVDGNGRIPSANLDKAFVDKTGDTMTGGLTVTTNGKSTTFDGEKIYRKNGSSAAKTYQFPDSAGKLALQSEISTAIVSALQDLARNGIVVDGRTYRLVADPITGPTGLAQAAGLTPTDDTTMGDIEGALGLQDSNTVQDALDALPGASGLADDVAALRNGDLYVKNRSTGLLHGLSASTTSMGQTTVAVEQTGVPPADR